MGGAQPLAVTMNGGAVLIVDVDESRLARRVEHGYLDEYTTDLDAAIARVVAAKDAGEALSVGVVGNAAEVFGDLLLRGTPIDIVTDQTSAHDPLAYLPVGVAFEDWKAEAERDPEAFTARARGSHGQARRRDGRIPGCRSRGLRLRQLDPPRGAARRLRAGVRVPRLRAGLHPAAVRRRARARSAGWRCRATPRTSARPIEAVKALFPDNAGLVRWLDKAADAVHFEGLPARICWLGYQERHLAGLKFNEMVASGELVGADRDRPRPPRLGLGRLARTARPRRWPTARTRSPTGRC